MGREAADTTAAMLRVGNALPRAVLKRMGFLRRNNAPALTGAGSCMLRIAEQRQRVQKDMVGIKVSFVSAQTGFMAGVALRVKILPRFLGRALMRGVLIPAVPAGAGEQPLVAGGIVRALVGLPCTGSQGMGGVFILAVSAGGAGLSPAVLRRGIALPASVGESMGGIGRGERRIADGAGLRGSVLGCAVLRVLR